MTKNALSDVCKSSPNRLDLWKNIINGIEAKKMAEIGVYRGRYAAHVLKGCPAVEDYYMIDPWRNLAEWNKPANKDNDTFEGFLNETKSVTDFAAEKRHILRGTTTEVIEQIEDNALDFIYIDGDHTLKGITIDLVRTWPKVKPGSWVGGDDFTKSIWQHSLKYEPTLVFPFVVYFAEAMGCSLFALPYSQFLLKKDFTGYSFTDFTGKYAHHDIRHHVRIPHLLKHQVKNMMPRLSKIKKMVKGKK